MKNYKKILY
ncbi:UNVERIFIED_CONTAM: hypothetical protein GTU68_005060 [Idotea baltica]|nr:hypothetical protein [Idotea baltica]